MRLPRFNRAINVPLMGAPDLAGPLAEFCRRALGEGATAHVERLSGGANMESWRFTHAGRALVLRRLPPGMAEGGLDSDGSEALSLAAQADMIETARAGGVTAPAIVARLAPADGLGEGFVMAHVDGEVLPHKILGQPDFAAAEANLTAQCARELARIHALDPAACPDELTHRTPAEMLADLRERYRDLGGKSPICEFAFGWLKRNLPEPVPPRVLHGDFRMGNLIVDHDGLAAVLDWELAHLGDPAQDLAYLATPSWRFTRHDRPVGGFGAIDHLLAAYREAGGESVDPARFHYWLIYSCLWWGICCLSMADIWREGGDRSLERIVIGRRFSEVEVDLLLLFEDRLALPRRPMPWALPEPASNSGEPVAAELLEAAEAWLKASAVPALDGRSRFEARVAANAVGIAAREAAWDTRFAADALMRLRALGHDSLSLGPALERGEIGLASPAVRDHLRRLALERCSVDQPGYAGLKTALRRWTDQIGES